MPQLLKKLPLEPDESVVSLVQRHCEANYVDRMLDMLRLIARVAGEPVEDVRDIAHSRTALTAVERLTGQAAGALDDCFLAPVQGTHVRARHHVWELGLRRTETQAVCLVCLHETGYARRSWEFIQAPVCLVHGVALFERCPSCTKPLRHRRTRLLACESCGCALGKSLGGPTGEQAGRLVPQAALEVAHLVQRPVMLAMGDPDYTAPIDPQELSGLLRLCLPVGAGRDPMSGLSTGLESLSVAERIEALDRLGAALLDRRIDSARLRAVVESRWLWARHAPAVSRLHLLRNAALAAELAPDVTRLLCHGSDVRRDVPAAVQFAKRPPRLESQAEVAAFLGVDVDTLAAVAGSSLLTRAKPGQGHDMDEVLAVQTALEGLLSIEQVDTLLGLPGLAQALLTLKLLSSVKAADGTIVGVKLEALDKLMSGIQAVVDTRSADKGDVSAMAEGTAYGMDTTQMAWATAQVQSGSLRALAWPAPHRLMDLVVDGRRLRALSNWPATERAQADTTKPT